MQRIGSSECGSIAESPFLSASAPRMPVMFRCMYRSLIAFVCIHTRCTRIGIHNRIQASQTAVGLPNRTGSPRQRLNTPPERTVSAAAVLKLQPTKSPASQQSRSPKPQTHSQTRCTKGKAKSQGKRDDPETNLQRQFITSRKENLNFLPRVSNMFYSTGAGHLFIQG